MKALRALGRAARWALRLLVALAILAVAAVLAARSDLAGRYAADQVAASIEKATGRPARVGRSALSVFPPGIRVQDVAVARGGGSFDDPVLRVREASASISIVDLLAGRIVVDAVEADRVDLLWGVQEAAREATPRRTERRTDVTLHRLNLTNGSISYRGQTVPFTLEAEGIAATASSVACEDPICLDVSARAGAFSVAYEGQGLSGDRVSISAQLRGDRLTLDRFSVAGPGLRVKGTASWDLGPEGVARLTAEARTSDPATSSLLGPLPLTARTLDLSATFTIAAGRAEGSGDVRATDLDYPGLAEASGASGTFSFREGGISAKIRLSGVSPRLAGLVPSSAGSATVELTRSREGEGSLSFSAGPVLYRELLTPIDARLPVVDVLANAGGRIDWHTGDAESLQGSVDVDLAPWRPGSPALSQEANPPPAQGRPRADLIGSATFGIAPHVIRISGGWMSLGKIEADVEGTIGRPDGTLGIDIALRRLEVGETLGILGSLPAAGLAAKASLTGILTGRIRLSGPPRSPEARGVLEGPALGVRVGDEIVFPVEGRAEWIYARGDLLVSALSLAGAGWSAKGDLRIDTRRAWPFRGAHFTASDLPCSVLWPALGVPALEGGFLSGTGSFDLDAVEPGEISLVLEKPTVAKIPADEIRLEAVSRGHEIEVRSLAAASPAGRIEATGSFNPDAFAGSFDLRSGSLDLGALLAAIAPGSPEGHGKLALTGALQITRDHLSFRSDMKGEEIDYAGLVLGEMTATLEAGSGTEGAVEAHVQARAIGADGEFRYDPADGSLGVSLTLSDLDLGVLQPLLPPASLQGIAGRASGKIQGTIPAADPYAADLNARIDALTLSGGGLTLSTVEPADLTLRGGEIWLSSTRLTGTGTDLTVSGIYNLKGRAAGDGSLTGRFDARLVALLLPALDARGSVEIDVHASATESGFTYGGRLRTEGARLNYPGLPTPLDALKLTAELERDGTLRIRDISFTAAGGEVKGEGVGHMEGLDPKRVEIRLRGANLRVEPLPKFNLLFDGEATVVKEGLEGRMKGRLDVVRAVYSEEFSLEPKTAFGRSRVAPEERAPAAGSSFALDLEVVAPSDVWVRNESTQLEGSARLHVGGTIARPELTGRISVFEGGSFRFRDVEYRSEAGGIDLDDPDVIDPLLDITAVTQVQEYAIRLHVLGRYSRPRFELTSEPALPPRDIVSLLIYGRTYSESAGTDASVPSMAEETVGQYLTLPVAERLMGGVQRALHLTSVQIAPQFLGGGTDPTARITLTKRVNPQLLFVYSTNVGSSQEQIYQFQYDLARTWQVVAMRDFDGSESLNLRFLRRWGGPPQQHPGAAAPGSGFAGGSAELRRIELPGVPEPLGKKARRKLKLHEGRRYTRGDALEARENLRGYLAKRGYPLAVVRMNAVPVPGVPGDQPPEEKSTPAVDLRFEVEPGPRVDANFEGVQHTRALRKAVWERWENIVDPEDLVPSGEKGLQNVLGGDARAAAKITSDVKRTERAIRITYHIDRGPKVSVRSIRFDGAVSVPEEEIRRAMITREDRWNTSGRLVMPALMGDVEAIRAVYLSHGHLDARVQDPVIKLSPDRKKADLVISVEEGPQWRVGEIVIEGAAGYPAESLKEATMLSPGAIIRPSALEAAVDRVRDVLDANGFNTAKVRSRLDGPPEKAVVTIAVEEGPRQTIGRVIVRGNTLTRDRVIAREIELVPGDPLSRTGMLKTQRDLYARGIFRSAEVKGVPDPNDPNRAKMVVDIVEGDPLMTSWALGYNSTEGVQGATLIGHNNIFGSGRAASILLRASRITQRVQLSLSERRMFGFDLEGLATMYRETQERESFNVRRTGGAFQLTRRPSKEITLLGRYSIEDVSPFDVEVATEKDCGSEFRNCRLANVAGSIARDTRDDILAPTRGTFSTADLRLYLTAVGSEEQFAKLFTSLAAFHRLGRRVVLAGSARLGTSLVLGGTPTVPLTERFFAGGDTSLRGFETDKAGPLQALFSSSGDPNASPDVRLEPIGGELEILLNGEIRFPIWGALGGVLFYDAGNVFLDSSALRFSGTEVISVQVPAGSCPGNPTATVCPVVQDGIRHVLGAGLRVDTPLGPLRLEYGRKMDRRFGAVYCADCPPGARYIHRDESLYTIFLSVGHAF